MYWRHYWKRAGGRERGAEVTDQHPFFGCILVAPLPSVDRYLYPLIRIFCNVSFFSLKYIFFYRYSCIGVRVYKCGPRIGWAFLVRIKISVLLAMFGVGGGFRYLLGGLCAIVDFNICM